MILKAAIASVLPFAAIVACKAQAPQISQSQEVTVILHQFYAPTMVRLSVGPQVVFRGTVQSEPTSGVASSMKIDLRDGDRFCASVSNQDHCKVVTASDLSKKFLLVGGETRSFPFDIEFVDQPLLD